MNTYTTRPLKIKAWNTATRLMMRLDHVDCVKGELNKEGYILLLFTGCYDGRGDELYDQDVFLLQHQKYKVYWKDYGWFYCTMQGEESKPLVEVSPASIVRLGNWFEMEGVG